MASTLYHLWRCDRGARWTTTFDNPSPGPCTLVGCDERAHTATRVATTGNQELAHRWTSPPAPHA